VILTLASGLVLAARADVAMAEAVVIYAAQVEPQALQTGMTLLRQPLVSLIEDCGL
jgi:hypothetical protein